MAEEKKKRTLDRYTQCWHLSHRREKKALTSLRICTGSPERSLLAYAMYGSRGSFESKILTSISVGYVRPNKKCAFRVTGLKI